MKTIIALTFCGLLAAGCAANGEKGISPAEGALATCETYAVTLNTLSNYRAQGKLNAGTVKVVDHTISYVGPYCKGPAPDVDANAKDVAIDAGVKVLQSIIFSVIQ